MSRPLRIAILAHSTNPRGGVVHGLELADALTRLGHEAVLHAPDPKAKGFFRQGLARTVSVPALPAPIDTAAMVRQRVHEYVAYFQAERNRRFDVFHAQDGISANALAVLRARGIIPGFARTVHHIDHFADPALTMMQTRSIVAADSHFVVSRAWADRLAEDFGIAATLVGNGVDRSRFTPGALPAGDPILLAIGGVEARKNTLGILEGFIRLRRAIPNARLIIAGGASLLDHAGYQTAFSARLAASGLPSDAVTILGPVEDAAMPALYRSAHALVFPSLKEGFGLVVLESMASGLPVVTSRIQPFTEYLSPDDAAWCDPNDAASIAEAMAETLGPNRAALRTHGLDVAARHDWLHVASAHLPAYRDLCLARTEDAHHA